MKITRKVDGIAMSFELTAEELLAAHKEQEHAWDMSYVRSRYDDHDVLKAIFNDDPSAQSTGYATFEEAVNGIAEQMREYINSGEMRDQDEAFSKACDYCLKEVG